MNTYKAFYKNKTIEVQSDSSYHAQLEAAKLLGAKKSFQVTVGLVEKDGQSIIHTADF